MPSHAIRERPRKRCWRRGSRAFTYSDPLTFTREIAIGAEFQLPASTCDLPRLSEAVPQPSDSRRRLGPGHGGCRRPGKAQSAKAWFLRTETFRAMVGSPRRLPNPAHTVSDSRPRRTGCSASSCARAILAEEFAREFQIQRPSRLPGNVQIQYRRHRRLPGNHGSRASRRTRPPLPTSCGSAIG